MIIMQEKLSSGALENAENVSQIRRQLQADNAQNVLMASLISCEILKIININEINEEILTSRHVFHFPFSSLRFLLSQIRKHR